MNRWKERTNESVKGENKWIGERREQMNRGKERTNESGKGENKWIGERREQMNRWKERTNESVKGENKWISERTEQMNQWIQINYEQVINNFKHQVTQNYFQLLYTWLSQLAQCTVVLRNHCLNAAHTPQVIIADTSNRSFKCKSWCERVCIKYSLLQLIYLKSNNYYKDTSSSQTSVHHGCI